MKRSDQLLAGIRKSGPAQRKLGTLQKGDRIASKYEKTDRAELIRQIAQGAPVDLACAAVGISGSTFQSWLSTNPEFARELAAEKLRVVLETLDKIKKCSSKGSEFRHLTWFLERVYPDAFAPPQQNGPSFIQNNLTLGNLDEARRILDDAKKLPYRQQPTESPQLATGDTE